MGCCETRLVEPKKSPEPTKPPSSSPKDEYKTLTTASKNERSKRLGPGRGTYIKNTSGSFRINYETIRKLYTGDYGDI